MNKTLVACFVVAAAMGGFLSARVVSPPPPPVVAAPAAPVVAAPAGEAPVRSVAGPAPTREVTVEEGGSIQAAVTAAQPDTIIRIKPGTYHETVYIDKDGIRLDDALKAMGVDLDQAHLAKRRIEDVKAYLELHIEQGPVLESEGLAVGAVLGTVGVERYTVTFRGQAAHAGSTPMLQRKDTFSAAARFALLLRDVAIRHEGVSTIGNANCTPGVVTAVPGVTEILVDQRHIDADTLAAMNADARVAAHQAAEEFGCTVEWEQLWRIPPIPFDPALIEDARAAVREVTGTDRALPSGPLHDAAEMARMVPTVMLFASSINGLSHCIEEDTPEEHLLLAAEAFGIAVGRAIERVGKA
jgi:N-carbamoyl-L-amino-acid hydrolase